MANKLTIDKFYWGMSKDSLYAQQWQFDYAENMNFNNTSYLTLWTKAEKFADSNEITSIISVKNGNYSKAIFITKRAEVYTTSSTDNTPDYDLSTITNVSDKPIYNSFIYRQDLFLVQQWYQWYFYVHKISMEDAYNGDWWNLEAQFMKWETNSVDSKTNSWFPLVVDNSWYVYIGNLKTLVTFDINTGWLSWQPINVDWEIRGVTLWTNTFKVYTNNWFLLYYTSEWDLQERVNITISPSIVKTIKNIDYIIWSFSNNYDNSLYYMNWYKVENVIQNDSTWKYKKWRIMDQHSDNLQFDWKKIYFIVEDKNYNHTIASIWPIKNWFPEAINYEINWFNDEDNVEGTLPFDIITCFYSYKWIIYIWHNGWIWQYNVTNQYDRQREWLWLSSKYNFGSSTIKKEIVEIRIRWNFIGDWNKFSVVLDWTTKTFITLPSGQVTDIIRLTNFNEEFINIQFEWHTKTITSTWSASELYWIELIYNIIED